MATVIEIEPSELSVLVDCDVSLDALNYLGKRLDGMDESEHKQYFAALSCPEISEGWGLKNIINLTDNLTRYTLIEDTDDLERIGLIHMLNIRGGPSESEYTNSEWLAAEGKKLLDSGKGIDTEYGKIFVNDEIPFCEHFRHSIKFCVKSKSDQTRCGLQSKHGLGFSLNSHAPASRNGMRAAGVNTVSARGKNIKRGNPITRILCPRTLSKAGRKPYPNSDKLLSNVT